jgi:hypothetical protein
MKINLCGYYAWGSSMLFLPYQMNYISDLLHSSDTGEKMGVQ